MQSLHVPPNNMSCTVSCRHGSHIPIIAVLSACRSKVHVMYLYVLNILTIPSSGSRGPGGPTSPTLLKLVKKKMATTQHRAASFASNQAPLGQISGSAIDTMDSQI